MSRRLREMRENSPVLTTIAHQYRQRKFISEQIMPVVPTEKEGIRVPKFGKASFFEYDTTRAVGASSNIITLDTPTLLDVMLEEHDLAAGVDWREQRESMFNEQVKATRRVTAGVQLKQEIEAARLLQNPSSYASGHVKSLISLPWDNEQSRPELDIAEGKSKIRSACGMYPNVLVVGADVFKALSWHKGLRGMLGNNEHKTLLSTEALCQLLDVKEIIVGEAVSTPSHNKEMVDIWGNFAALVVRPEISETGNDEGEPAFGYTFRLRGMPMVDTYDEVGGKVQYVRYTDVRKVAAIGGDCGYLFQNAVNR